MHDLVVPFDCGCEVVFLAECHLKTSRMTCCEEHNGRDWLAQLARDQVQTLARQVRDQKLARTTGGADVLARIAAEDVDAFCEDGLCPRCRARSCAQVPKPPEKGVPAKGESY